MSEEVITSKPLGERLLEAGLLTKTQLSLALRQQKREGGRLGEILSELGIVKPNVVSSFLAEETSTDFVDVRSSKPDHSLRDVIPEAIARRYRALPLSREGDVLTVALGDPFDVVATDMLEQISGLSVKVVTASEADIVLSLDRLFAEGDQVEDTIDTVMEESAEKARLAAEAGKEQAMGGDEGLVDLVQQILTRAIEEGASDIHFNPEANTLALRVRVDGVLQQDVMLPKKLQAPVIARLKIMAELNVAETRIPQDGRSGIVIGQREISLRVSTLPTVYGENVVLRVLDPSALDLTLEDMGFRKPLLKAVNETITRPNGVVLVTGPTGSGKSTTLYAVLGAINKPGVSIFTLEDPVEYRLNLIRQTQINDKVGMTFNTGLRALLRQDPEIILVGETRDQETAELMIRAALTGHLVFTTLHTNDAAGCIPRLIDMGVEPYLLPSCLQGALAQRLGRTICKNCKIEEKDPEQVFAALKLTPPSGQPLQLWTGEGCEKCRYTGYKGRVGIHEFMQFDQRFYEPICNRAESSVYVELAREAGFLTMYEDGVIKALEGRTDLKEVLRCCQGPLIRQPHFIMPIYNYIALNTKDGKSVSGAMEVPDEPSLEAKLIDMGFALQKAVKQKPKKKGSSRISRRDMIDFYNLMIYQVNAGLSVVESLTTAASECKNYKLKDALGTVERKVKSGMMFFEALDGFPAAFPPNVVNMVRAGEMSCKLPETFKDLREYEEWQEKMQADIRQATIYPIIILVVMGAFILLLFTLVIPKFIVLLETLKLELPLVTKLVFQSSDFAKDTWWIWVIGFFGSKYGTRFARKRYEWFALQYDRLMLMLPAFGKLNIMISMSRLMHNMGSLVGAGLTVLDALHHCRELVGNKVVEVALRQVKADVTAGVDFSEALAKHKVFPEMVIKMVALGEGTGFLEDALENASEFYSQAIPRQTKKIFSLLEPVLMLFIIGLIGTVALSIFMPIMEMMTGAKG